MSITIEQSDTTIRETFYNMEEGIEYVLNDFWFQQTNRIRKEHHYSPLKDKREYKFSRKGDHLIINNDFVFDFDGKSTFALALAFASPALAIALQHGGIEKRKSYTCEGKVVEIDGKKYKLTLV